MKTIRLVSVSLVLVSIDMLAAGCGAADPEPSGASDEALLGDVGHKPFPLGQSCSADVDAMVDEAIFFGRVASASNAFEECLTRAIPGTATSVNGYTFGPYMPCNGSDSFNHDPLRTAPVAEQLRAAIEVTRSRNPIAYGCDPGMNIPAAAPLDDVGATGTEVFNWGTSFVQGSLASVSPANEQRGIPYGNLAMVVWHEAMHQHGYSHGSNTTDGAVECGYAPGTYKLWVNSMTDIVQLCMAEVIQRSGDRCNGMQTCGGGALEIIDGYDGTSCSCVSDPRPGASGTIVGIGGNCLHASGTTNGAPLDMSACSGASNQRFSYSATQELRGLGGDALDALGWATDDGAPVGMWSVDHAWNQRWKIANAEIHGLGGKVVDVIGSNRAEGAQVGIWGVDGAPNQKWTFTLGGEIEDWDGKCLDEFPVTTGESWSVPDGTPLTMHTCNGSPNQKWTVMPGGALVGFGNKCLTVENVSTVNGTRLVSWTCNGGSNQAWSMKGELRDWNEQCLDVAGSRTDSGAPVALRTCGGTMNQRFSLFP